MEGIHGVDVSWLHRPNRDNAQKDIKVTEKVAPAPPESKPAQNAASQPKVNGVHHVLHHNRLHRSHLNQSVTDKEDLAGQTNKQTSLPPSPSTPPPQTPSKGNKESKLGATGRRGSWMSNLSSKFSSSSSVGSTTPSPETNAASKAAKGSQADQANPLVPVTSPKDIKKSESPASTPPGSPKASHTFLQSALRRLSSGGSTSIGKAAGHGNGGICPRKTMNVDPYRERCSLPELDQSKLRRVSFCVDVEIAGSAQYVDELPEEPNTAPSIDAPSTLTKLSKELETKKGKDQKTKDQKLQKGEAEALKNPEAVAAEKDALGVVKATGEDVSNDAAKTAEPADATQAGSKGTAKEPSKKKEKKKRSESERKERKERKQREAIANGTIPAEIKNDGSGDSTPGSDTPPKSQDRPTTDPLRIYRRCCQLRETPILKKIAEQISSPSACPVATPGILTVLDLSGYWMQLPDIVTLGDYLAVVPVKKLILENCGLGDEGVRVLLAGLLAAKTPEQAKYNRRLVKKARSNPEKDATERLGVVEKICLKNNPKIGKEGWRHIFTFIYMSRSLKAIDLSMISFPESFAKPITIKPQPSENGDVPSAQTETPSILYEAISGRLGADRLEELVMAECGLDTDSIGQVTDAVIKCGVTRLGLANNNITKEGMEHVIRYLRSGVCMGLDIGGNDIHEYLDMFADAIVPDGTLWALSLADCQLLPSSLEKLLPALTKLQNFRFIDLSHNRELFASKPSALGLIRKCLPRLHALKRLHLMDVAMTSEHAIALAETLPECTSLAHLNILENHLLSPLANAKMEADQEEACALYASLMAAVRVSETIICIDVDVPTPESSEIVKALAKQVVAYSLYNLERLPLNETADSAIASVKQSHGGDKGLTYPDVLMHLVGHVEGVAENHDHDPPAPDNDYIVGGTGVVKALDICLNRAERGRKNSADVSPMRSGTGTPKTALQDGDISQRKAKEMSKNLLGSARKIRERLQPALVKELKSGNDMSYRRLQFLDATLRGMILRFEEEYPETRIEAPNPIVSGPARVQPSTTGKDDDEDAAIESAFLSPTTTLEDDDEETGIRPGNLSRRPSTPGLASRQAQEEGQFHLIGQRIRRDVFRPESEDYAHGVTGSEPPEPEHITQIRRKMESYPGEEIRERLQRLGPEALFQEIRAECLGEGISFKEGDEKLMGEELAKWNRERLERHYLGSTTKANSQKEGEEEEEEDVGPMGEKRD